MLAIRLNRTGKRNKSYFRIALQEHTIAPGGTHVEILGNYNPHTKKALFKAERIKYWISKGAQPSDTAYNLFVREGIIIGKKRAVRIPEKSKSEKPEDAKSEVKPAEINKSEVKKEEKTKDVKEELKKAESKPKESKTEKAVDKK